MLKIPRHILEAMIAWAKQELPNEACGLLTGEGDTVRAHHPLTNTDHSPEHFSLDPKEQFAVLKTARAAGQKILANYHSHPSSPARPSQEDIRLAADPRTVYVIISLSGQEPVVKAFSSTGTSMSPCALEVV